MTTQEINGLQQLQSKGHNGVSDFENCHEKQEDSETQPLTTAFIIQAKFRLFIHRPTFLRLTTY
jgi:hypothetical protein